MSLFPSLGRGSHHFSKYKVGMVEEMRFHYLWDVLSISALVVSSDRRETSVPVVSVAGCWYVYHHCCRLSSHCCLHTR